MGNERANNQLELSPSDGHRQNDAAGVESLRGAPWIVVSDRAERAGVDERKGRKMARERGLDLKGADPALALRKLGFVQGVTSKQSMAARLRMPKWYSLLVQLGKELEPKLFAASEIDVVTVAKHRYAWPRWSAAHATRVSAWLQRPPIVFAGDWTWHPFVEGALRSGQRAADVLIRAWISA